MCKIRFPLEIGIFLLIIVLIATSCISVNPPPVPVPTLTQTPTSTPTSMPTPTAIPTTPTASPSPTPTPILTPTQEVPLPRIEAFVADPSYNPGGSRLSGLSDAKVIIDTAWQRLSLSNQPYYYTIPALTDRYKPYDTVQLQKALDELKKTPWVSLYKLNYFDCTGMSALLQRELAIRGFESWIVIGKDPNGPIGHAWVVVFLRSPSIKLVPVEATALLIPQPGSTYYLSGVVQTYEDYSRQGWVLQDIYQAVAWLPMKGKFDWWNQTDILQKLGLPTIVIPPTTTPPTPPPTITIPPSPPPPTTTVPPIIPQPIEVSMQGVSFGGLSYMNHTRYLQAGDVIDGVVQLTGPSGSVDNYQWQFQILGPGGESIKLLTGDFRTAGSLTFHVVASYAGTYRIRVTHQSISTKTLSIHITPPGWGYANLE